MQELRVEAEWKPAAAEKADTPRNLYPPALVLCYGYLPDNSSQEDPVEHRLRHVRVPHDTTL